MLVQGVLLIEEEDSIGVDALLVVVFQEIARRLQDIHYKRRQVWDDARELEFVAVQHVHHILTEKKCHEECLF